MIRVLQLIDSLEAGGAERLSINVANGLADEIDGSFICVTRAEGPLKSSIDKSVGYLFLKKRSTLDLKAIFKLKKYIKNNRISIIHAHSSSFFLGFLVKLIYPRICLIWHDHYGNSEFLEERPNLILKVCSYFFSHIFCVNRTLKDWSIQYLNCKSVSYLQNFTFLKNNEELTDLKGVKGKRIVCLANLRPQKDHLNLLNAFNMLLNDHLDWSLHCIGKDFNDDYSRKLKEYIREKGLLKHVFFYGSRQDISYILSQCEVGVLSSKSEGLPIALLEYGFSKLAVVATNVGDCELVVNSTELGALVPPENPESLSLALKRCVESPQKRLLTANKLHMKVISKFSKPAVIHKVIDMYSVVLTT